MEKELLAVAEKIEQIEYVLKKAKVSIRNVCPAPSDILPSLIVAYSELGETLNTLEDIEMSNVDFEGINLDAAFEGNPVSDYVQAGIDYVSGDVEAVGRMMDAASRITSAVTVTREEDLLEVILEREEAFAIRLDEALIEIEDVLEGTDIDNWSETQLELARYFLSVQPDTSVYEVESLTPHGIKMVWKRRRYLGAAK